MFEPKVDPGMGVKGLAGPERLVTFLRAPSGGLAQHPWMLCRIGDRSPIAKPNTPPLSDSGPYPASPYPRGPHAPPPPPPTALTVVEPEPYINIVAWGGCRANGSGQETICDTVVAGELRGNKILEFFCCGNDSEMQGFIIVVLLNKTCVFS